MQAVGKFLIIAVPLAARQRVQMRQRGTVLIVSGKIEPAGIDLIRVGRFLAGKLTHQGVRLAALTRAVEIARQTIGYPHVARRERQTTTLDFCCLGVFPLIFQLFGLGGELLVGQTTLDIINAPTLAGGKRLDKLRGFLRGLRAVNIGQAANRVAVAAVHSQRLTVITLRRVVIFTRRGGVAQPQHRVAVGIVDVTRLLIVTLCLRRVIRLQRRIALLDQQPVAVNLQKTIPLTPIIALGIEGNRLFKLCHRAGAVALLGIRLPQGTHRFTVGMVGADGFLQLGHRLTALPGIHRREPFRFRAKRRIGELFLLRFKLGTRRSDAIPVAEYVQIFLQRADAGAAGRLVFDLVVPHIRRLAAAIGGFGHLLQYRKAFITSSALEQKLGQRCLQLRIPGAAAVNFFQLVNGRTAASWIFRHDVPVFRRHVATRRVAVKQLVIGGNRFLRVPRSGEQSRLLELLSAIRSRKQHGVARGLVSARTRGDPFQTIQLFLRAGVIALTQQVAKARGNDVRVVGVNQLKAIERLTNQILTLCRFAQPDLLQQLFLLRRVGGLCPRHKRQAKR